MQVKLTDFGVYYRQEDVDALVASLKNGASNPDFSNPEARQGF